MMNRIRHNSPSQIQCLRAFHILFFSYLLFRWYCYNHYKTQKYYFCYRYRYFHITLLLNTFLQILSYPGVVELTTQLVILENILWLPLCRINKLGLNTLPSKTIAIPYTCGLSTVCCNKEQTTKEHICVGPSFVIFRHLSLCERSKSSPAQTLQPSPPKQKRSVHYRCVRTVFVIVFAFRPT